MPTAEELAGKPTGTTEGSGSTETQSTAGAIDYSKIDYSKIDWYKVPVEALPEDVIKETPTAKKLLEETIERRKTIKHMKEALGEKPAEDTHKPATKVDDTMPEWARSLIGEVQSIKTATQRQELDKVVDEQMAALKLPADVREFISGNTADEIKAKAAKLAKTYTQTDNTSAGAGGDGTGGDTIQNRAKAIIEAKLKSAVPVADSNQSIFSGRVQSIK